MHGVRDLGPPIADVDAPQAGKGVDVISAVLVVDVDAICSPNDMRIAEFSMRKSAKISVRMDDAAAVHLL